MKWIGLTGGIATGKSTVTKILREQGLPVVDADELAREVVRAGTDGHREVVAAFGASAVLPSGELNRKEIAARVFGHPEKLRELETIIHPRVRVLQHERRAKLAASGHKLGFYDVPLLFEKNLEGDFDVTVVVSCDPETQLRRLLARDGISEAEAQKRIASQLALSEKEGRADHVLRNDGSIEDLKKATLALIHKL